jgi:ubiquinol-cytochrome c reductase iron-sulfur subunit
MSNVEDSTRRRLWGYAATAMGGALVGGVGVSLVRTLQPTETALDAHRRRVDVNALEPGKQVVIEFLQAPVLVMRRTEAMLSALGAGNPRLADPASDRSIQPEAAKNDLRSLRRGVLVVNPSCTHLGCKVELRNDLQALGFSASAEKEGLFMCPCHGALFDLAGRVYQNTAAPTNLVVPPHEFTRSGEVEFKVG